MGEIFDEINDAYASGNLFFARPSAEEEAENRKKAQEWDDFLLQEMKKRIENKYCHIQFYNNGTRGYREDWHPAFCTEVTKEKVTVRTKTGYVMDLDYYEIYEYTKLRDELRAKNRG
jgi:hypothetical protein